jgi:ParB family chromosome partitioning protein
MDKKEESPHNKVTADVPKGTWGKIFPEELVLISDKKHPLYDSRVELPLDDKLVKSIMVYGVLNPIGCRRNGDKYEVVSGNRRVKAAREVNRLLAEMKKDPIKVDIRIRRGEEKHIYGILVSENEHRVDDNPLDKARKAQHMLDFRSSDDEVCATFGITKTCLNGWKNLLDLCPTVKKAIENGEITATAAVHLVDLNAKEQVERLEEMRAEGGKITAERTFRAVREGNGSPGRRIRSRKQIEERLETEKDQKVIETLRWVLNVED